MMLILLPIVSTTISAEESNIQIETIKAINGISWRRTPGVLVQITNEGDANASDATISINVKHGLFRKINFTMEKNIDLIPAGEKAFMYFGLSWIGRIQITITTDDDTETVRGRVILGRILILKK